MCCCGYRPVESRSNYGFSLPSSPTPLPLPSLPRSPSLSPLRTKLPPFRVAHRTRFPQFRTNVASSSSSSVSSPSPFGEAVSFYDLLGIPETGTSLEIKRAYKQLVLKYHPDVSPPDQVEEYTRRFIRVQEAYETLSDPRRRAMYDRDMSRGLHLAFSARRRHYPAEMEVTSGWKNRWQSQLSELKRRSMDKENGGNSSWAAAMRQRRNGSSS